MGWLSEGNGPGRPTVSCRPKKAQKVESWDGREGHSVFGRAVLAALPAALPDNKGVKARANERDGTFADMNLHAKEVD